MKHNRLFFCALFFFSMTSLVVMPGDEAIDLVGNIDKTGVDARKLADDVAASQEALNSSQRELSVVGSKDDLDTVKRLMSDKKREFKVASAGVQDSAVISAEMSALQEIADLARRSNVALERVGGNSVAIKNSMLRDVKQGDVVVSRDQLSKELQPEHVGEKVGGKVDDAPARTGDALAEYATRVKSADRDLVGFAKQYATDLSKMPQDALGALGATEKDVAQLQKDLASKNAAKVKAAGLKVAKLKMLYYLYAIAYRSEYGPYGYSSSKTGYSYEPSPYVGWGSYTG